MPDSPFTALAAPSPASGKRQSATARKRAMLIVALVAANLLCNIVANVCFKQSVAGHGWQHLLLWQVLGNIAGLLSVITLTLLLRSVPLHVAYPVTTGLAVIGVQVLAARAIFGESIDLRQWLGTLLIVGGIFLIGGQRG
jgi:undecaprenyl phosphate-alpha-L-ara4N flippase subunit ArnE